MLSSTNQLSHRHIIIIIILKLSQLYFGDIFHFTVRIHCVFLLFVHVIGIGQRPSFQWTLWTIRQNSRVILTDGHTIAFPRRLRMQHLPYHTRGNKWWSRFVVILTVQSCMLEVVLVAALTGRASACIRVWQGADVVYKHLYTQCIKHIKQSLHTSNTKTDIQLQLQASHTYIRTRNTASKTHTHTHTHMHMHTHMHPTFPLEHPVASIRLVSHSVAWASLLPAGRQADSQAATPEEG